MRTVIEDEIYDANSNRLDKVVDFLTHIPADYKLLCDAINHVDTRLEGNNWRVQGYLDLEGLKYLLEGTPKVLKGLPIRRNVYMGFSNGKLEIWSMSVPYVKEGTY